jgi:tungstate transport system ATP-binding protein
MAERAPSPLPLRLDGVGFRARTTPILEAISLTLTAGPRTIVLGANGAGKSVLLRLCHGLLRPSAGSVRWAGDAENGRRRHAMVFQRPIMLRRATLANVAYGLKLAGIAKRARDSQARAKLDAVGLAALAERPARRLSGGEQQRVALARAWALEPDVLFLDEPTANLDPAATRLVERIVEAMHEAGTKIVMTTHDLGQARRLADEIVLLDRGRIAEVTPAAEFFAAPRSAAGVAFLRGELPPS